MGRRQQRSVMISSIDPAPSIISCGGKVPCSCPLVHKDFRKYSNREPRAPKKMAALLRQPATPPAWFGTPRDPLSASLTTSSIVLAYGLTECRSSGLTADSSILAQTHRQKFLEGRGAGRENLFPKRFPSPQAFLSSHLQASACHPRNKKSPAERGQKKTPSRCELQGGLEQSLAAATFPHDVMQYHRRWRA